MHSQIDHVRLAPKSGTKADLPISTRWAMCGRLRVAYRMTVLPTIRGSRVEAAELVWPSQRGPFSRISAVPAVLLTHRRQVFSHLAFLFLYVDRLKLLRG